MFWFKLPALSSDASLQTGTFIDCMDSGVINLSNSTVSYSIWLNPKGIKSQINWSYYAANLQRLLGWNHIAVSYKALAMRLFINGIQVYESNSTNLQLLTYSTSCYIGSSQDLQDPFNGYLRHLVFSLTGLDANANIDTLIHNVFLPFQSPNLNPAYSILNYFSFSSDFNYSQAYYYTASPTSSSTTNQNLYAITGRNVLIQQSNEPEFVCYCTNTSTEFLLMNQQWTMKKLSLSNNGINNLGFTLNAQIKALQQTSGVSLSDQVLFSIPDYSDIVLTNYASTIRVDLYSSNKVVKSLSFTNYRFRFSYWSSYSITVTAASVSLQVDGTSIQSFSHNVSLPMTASSLSMPSPTAISYLLSQISMSNANQVVVLNQSFDHQSLIKQNSLQQSGSYQFKADNTLCQSQQSSYWQSLGQNFGFCQDERRYSQFGTLQSAQSSMSGFLNSSVSQMTIEFWFKDQSSQSSKSVIFENSISIQISIVYSSSPNTIKCNPNANQQFDKSVSISNYTQTQNVWIHYACVSDGTNLKSITFNPATQALLSQTVGNSYFTDQQALNTSLGSSLDGTNEFIGYLREFRLWGTNRSVSDIASNRYYLITSSYSLLHYFMMNSDQTSYSTVDSLNNSISLSVSPSSYSAVQITQELDLVLCQPGLFFNGQCCQVIDFSNITLSVSYSPTKNFIVASLVAPATVNQNLVNLVQANFSLLSIGNNFNYTDATTQSVMPYFQFIKGYFSAQAQQTFNISSNLIDGKAQSLTFQVTIYSDYSQVYNYKTLNATLPLSCPLVWLYVLPNSPEDQTQIVSSVNQQQNLQISAQISSQCNASSQYTIQNVTWSMNLTTHKFTDLFTISSNSTQASAVSTISSLLPANNGYLKVTVLVSYYLSTNSKSLLSMSTSIYLNFTGMYISNTGSATNGFTTMQQSINLNIADQISIDLSELQVSVVSNSKNYQLTFNAQCPQSLFNYNTSLSQSQCQFNGSAFTLNPSNLSIIANYPYYFYFNVTIGGTSIFNTYTLIANYYKDSDQSNSSLSSGNSCPFTQIQNSYFYDKASSQTLLIVPDTFLNCSGTLYQVQSITWATTDSHSQQNISFLTYSNNTYRRYAIVNKQNTLTSVMAGQVLDITIIFQVFQISRPTSLITLQASSSIVFAQQPLVPLLSVFSNSSLSQTIFQVPFLTPLLLINGTSSYDPDNSSSLLSFQWECPPSMGACSSFANGSRNDSFIMNALQRAKIGFSSNQNYTFTLILSSLDNPYKLPMNANINLSFMSPLTTDTTGTNPMPALVNCESMSINSTTNHIYYVNSSYQKVLPFTKFSYQSDAWFYAYYKNNNTCKPQGNITEQLMVIYLFDGLFTNPNSSQSNLPSIIYDQVFKNQVAQQSLFVNLSSIPQFNINNMQLQSMYQANVYWFTQRQNSLWNLELISVSIFLERTKADLVAELTQSILTLDIYSSILLLNASLSYDPEQLSGPFYYIWTCPSQAKVDICSNQVSQIFTATYLQRVNASLNTLKQVYSYNVTMSDGQRNSQPATVTVNYTQANKTIYAQCLGLAVNASLTQGYQEDLNQTVFIQFNYTGSISIQMVAISACPSLFISLSQGQWSGNSLKQQLYTLISTNYSDTIKLQPQSLSQILQPLQYYPLVFNLSFYMGQDQSTIFTVSQYVNLYLNKPDLVALIVSTQINIFSSANSYSLTLDGSQSVDLAREMFSCYWTCPLMLCSDASSCVLKITDNSSSENYGQALEFTLTIVSADAIRQAQTSQYIYIGDPSQYPFNQIGISDCAINQVGSDSQTISYDQSTMFYFGCGTTHSGLNTQLECDPGFLWSADNLQLNQDYSILGDKLILNPYVSLSVLTLSLLLPNQTNPIKRNFQISLPSTEFIPGTITISPPSISQQFTAYSTYYNISINGFDTSTHTGLFLQMRGLSQVYEDATFIIIPIKELSPTTQNLFYSALWLPYVSTLYLDFFDVDMNYISSQNLLSAGTSINPGYYYSEQYLILSDQITSKTTQSYPQTVAGKAQFEMDVKRILEFSEMLTQDKVYGMNTYISANFTTNILTYHCSNFIVLTNSFFPYVTNTSSTDNMISQESRYQVEIKTILTLSNLINALTDLRGAISQILSIVGMVCNEFQLVIEEKDNLELIGGSMITLIDSLNSQVNLMNPAKFNISSLRLQVQSYNTTVIKAIRSTLAPGSTFSYQLDSSYRTIYKLQTQFPSYIPVQLSAPIPSSSQSVSLINEDYLVNYQQPASMADVHWNLNTNSSSVASNIVQIFLSDSDSNQITFSDFSVTTQPVSVFSLSLSLQQTQALIFKVFQSNSSLPYFYQPYCAYWDSTNNVWSQNGINQLGYDFDLGVMSCETTHLSTFMVDYVVLYKDAQQQSPSLNGSQSYNQSYNGTHIQTNNGTNQTLLVQSRFFQINHAAYSSSVAFSMIIIIGSLIIAVFKSRAFDKFRLFEEEEQLRLPKALSKIQVFKSLLVLYHPLACSAKFTSKAYTLFTIPILYKVVAWWTHLFLITTIVSQVIVVDYNKDSTHSENESDFNKKQLFLLVLLILQIVMPLYENLLNIVYYYKSNILDSKKDEGVNEYQRQSSNQQDNSSLNSLKDQKTKVEFEKADIANPNQIHISFEKNQFELENNQQSSINFEEDEGSKDQCEFVDEEEEEQRGPPTNNHNDILNSNYTSQIAGVAKLNKNVQQFSFANGIQEEQKEQIQLESYSSNQNLKQQAMQKDDTEIGETVSGLSTPKKTITVSERNLFNSQVNQQQLGYTKNKESSMKLRGSSPKQEQTNVGLPYQRNEIEYRQEQGHEREKKINKVVRIVLLVMILLFQFGLIFATYGLMYQFYSLNQVVSWIEISMGIFFVNVLLIHTFYLALFTLLYKRISKDQVGIINRGLSLLFVRCSMCSLIMKAVEADNY